MKMRGFIVAASIVACALVGSTDSVVAATDSAHAWSGVWQMTSGNKAGGTITLADDGGSLTGVIAFDVKNRETSQHIGTETRTMVNPHVQGDALVFQVRGILKPHMNGDGPASENGADPADIADMSLTPSSTGKAMLTCVQCGNKSLTEIVKAE